MHKNNSLYHFLLERARLLTEQWYEALDKDDSSGVYASDDPKGVEMVKKQNYEFHVRFCRVFDESCSEEEFLSSFDEWICKTSGEQEHQRTPNHLILREFFNIQEQYLDYVKEFVEESPETYSPETINRWKHKIIDNFTYVMLAFAEQSYKYTEERLAAQKEMIYELSSPVISLSEDLALLPLVGDIDTDRAQKVMENTLQQCSSQQVKHLLIDLSGVLIIDTMVAHQLFQLIKALKLIGVTCTLSGIRPEIAQTAIQIGIDFDDLSVVSSIHQALAQRHLLQ
ncbi:RsbT co-antagonist protein RsbRB (plasmid) [Priestia filamentosa]|uniref:RsbT co-antagonist protein RsbRB n=1 Tax=Priestia filamentosa TaxID=1402861 RepID=A0A1X7H0D6_9BACI|nr:STAS domain-containing protein [Priestia filamentosa]AVD54675.1 STAS domain-containing protein [Priestia filamentosa]AWG44779.1 RsbT co-antagonist protein RsbRB [Priestia filamentosa]OXS63564.1 RsbT co-antagonist protein RsbRB [Priestia filamentosa]SMF77263.1 rsbT co-antagonist protein RsbR [Priestia filamentosa]